MEEEPPIRITVYDKNYVRKGYVTSPNSVTILLAWNLPGSTTFEVNASHSRVNDLVAEGSRCVVEYRPNGKPWKTVMSGLVSERRGSGGPDATVREFIVVDDLDVLNGMVGYPVPANGPGSQSGSVYDTRTGPLENVIKDYVTANNGPRPMPGLTVQAKSGAGPTKTVKVRMTNLGEKLLPLATSAGLGVRVVQSPTGTTRQLQTWTPAAYPRELTEESGVVVGAEFSSAPPEVTRVIVGGGGEGTARAWRVYVDGAAEALWGFVRQEVIDARDIDQADPDFDALMAERGQERLDEGRAKSSLKASLVESGEFRYGVAFNLGDQVSVKPSGAAVITDRVREVEIVWDADGGLLVTPRVGEWSDDSASATHWKATRTALRRVNDLGTR